MKTKNNRSVSTTHIKVTATSQPLLYYVTLMCAIVCIQAGMGRGRGRVSTACRAALSVYLCVCVYLICAWDNDHCCVLWQRAISLSPLPLPTLSSCRPTVSPFTQQVSDYKPVGLVLQPPNFRESGHALSNYWYRYSVSVSKQSKSIGIGSIGKLWYRSHPTTYAYCIDETSWLNWPKLPPV